MRTVAFCESDPHCQRVLRHHWPAVPCFLDIRALTGAHLEANGIERIDVVCGGFPCQPFSSAARGVKRGKGSDTTLWLDMLRLVDETRPSWVIAENVANFDRLALEDVVSYLEGSGYQVAPPLVIPACAVGRDHRRDRYWIIGHSDRDGEPGRAQYAEVARLPLCRDDTGSMGAADGIPKRMDRMRMIGNAVDPSIVERIGRAIMVAEAPAA